MNHLLMWKVKMESSERMGRSCSCSDEYNRYEDNSVLFFFFQAEDGIRDADVTGVQTCALPISCRMPPPPCRTSRSVRNEASRPPWNDLIPSAPPRSGRHHHARRGHRFPSTASADRKERRVGKECRSRWSPYHEKKRNRR